MLRAPLAAALAALLFAAGPAGAAVVDRPAGPIHSVIAGGGDIAWLRCSARSWDPQIWIRSGAASPRVVAELHTGGFCSDGDLLGMAADRLVVDYTSAGPRDWLPRQLITVGTRDRSIRTLDENRPWTAFIDGDLHFFSAPAMAGASVTWWQQRYNQPDRLMAASLRTPGEPGAAVAERDGYVVGTWYNRRGDALLLLRGTALDPTSRLVLRTTDGDEREIAATTVTSQILGADLNDRWLTFTTKTAAVGSPRTARIHAWHLDPLGPVASWPVSLGTPGRLAARGSDIGRLAGDTLVWTTHAPRSAGIVDGIRAARLPGRAAPWIWSMLTRADRGVWVTRPAIAGRSAVVAVTRFPRGNPGQYEVGLRVRSRLLSVPLAPP